MLQQSQRKKLPTCSKKYSMAKETNAVQYYKLTITEQAEYIRKLEISHALEISQKDSIIANLTAKIDLKSNTHAAELATINQQHAQAIAQKEEQFHGIINATRMAHNSQTAKLGAENELLKQECVALKQEANWLEEQNKAQKLELDRHAGVTAEKRAIHARNMRLEYVKSFEKAYKSTTGEKKLSQPVSWLVKDFLANELVEDISNRPLMVSKVAFEEGRYDILQDDLLKIGIIASDRYLAEYGHRPPKYPRFVSGNPNIEVNIYMEKDRWIIQDAIKKHYFDRME